MNQELMKLRDLFRRWYGELSETEIMNNSTLIDFIQVIEDCFRSLKGEFS